MYPIICFVVAMYAEARPLIDALSLKEDLTYAPSLPMRSWVGNVASSKVIVVVNGKDHQSGLDIIGTQAATLNTHLAIAHYQPDLIISAGTAGAFKEKGASIGDVYLSYPYVIFHDRRVEIPGWKEMGVGSFDTLDIRPIALQLGLKTGIVTTGNSLDMPKLDEEMIRLYDGEIKEMEAAAVAWVASLSDIPFFCVKAVTDLVDIPHSTQEQFEMNLHKAVENLTKSAVDVLGLLHN